VLPGTRLDFFIKAVHESQVIVPLSGVPISCDSEGRCNGASGGKDHDHEGGR